MLDGPGYQVKTSRTNYNFEERSACPICGSKETAQLYVSPFTRPPVSSFIAAYYRIRPDVLSAAPYELSRCLDCSLVYQRWVGDDELLAELYGTWIEDHYHPDRDPDYAKQIGRALQSRDGHEIIVAAAFLGLRPTEMVTLDYGMGWGMWARIARELGCDSYGFDLAQPRMDYSRARGIATLEDSEIGPARFHFINTEQVMEHLVRPREVAEGLASALLPGGILKISVPSAERLDALIDKLKVCRGTVGRDMVMPVQPLEHVNSFTRVALTRLAEKIGLQIVEPPLRTKYAFLRWQGTLNLRRPTATMKELVRPYYQFHNSRNLYIWMQKPAQPHGRTSGR